eukprot:2715558-Pleurochrysis_carterae.AAC.1
MYVVGICLYAKSREGVATPARPCASDGSPPRAGSLPRHQQESAHDDDPGRAYCLSFPAARHRAQPGLPRLREAAGYAEARQSAPRPHFHHGRFGIPKNRFLALIRLLGYMCPVSEARMVKKDSFRYNAATWPLDK